MPRIPKDYRIWLALLSSGLTMFGLSGCGGPEFSPVTGTVTMDQKPLPDAMVSYMPADELGTPSFGRTDAAGNYLLRVSEAQEGAIVGKYKVRISTYVPGDSAASPAIPPVPERVPTRYNLETELEATVVSGDKEYNFAVESKGKIFRPDSLE